MEKQIKAMRMDKFLSQTLNVTRTEAKKMLKQGRISKNEVVCKDGAEKVIPKSGAKYEKDSDLACSYFLLCAV